MSKQFLQVFQLPEPHLKGQARPDVCAIMKPDKDNATSLDDAYSSI